VGDGLSTVRVEHLEVGDDAKVREAGALFDRAPTAEATADVLGRPDHHLLIAYDDDDVPAGFVTGVVMVHPDKGREMFVYELGVAESHRRRGYATALIRTLEQIARDAGCYGMFVLTDDDNTAAVATYTSAGARDEGPQRMLGWDF
jgi:ribosomal protein S18 acetylase RimI-like enzyme